MTTYAYDAESVQACDSTNGEDTCVLAHGHTGMHLGHLGTAWASTVVVQHVGEQVVQHGSTDPFVVRLEGMAYHPAPHGTEFSVPYISEVLPGQLWQGGCKDGLMLPTNIEHLVSLYPWQQYSAVHELHSELYMRWYDDALPPLHQLAHVARWVANRMEDGPVLVHCQAGLNRSSLVAAAALITAKGMEGTEAVYLLRERRSPACLCNPYFYEWIISDEARRLLWHGSRV